MDLKKNMHVEFSLSSIEIEKSPNMKAYLKDLLKYTVVCSKEIEC